MGVIEYEKQLKISFPIKFFISFRHEGFKTRTEYKGSLFMLFHARDFENHMFHFGEDGFCSDI